MASYSPCKLPKLSDPQLKAVHDAAQLACYQLTDPVASREAVQMTVHDAFRMSLEVVEKKGRLLKAFEQKAKLLQSEVASLKKQIQALTEKIETLEVSSAFYADEKQDAETQTEEEEPDDENMSWTENN